MENKRSIKSVLIWLCVPILLVVAIYLMSGPRTGESPKYAEILSYFEMGSAEFDAMESFDFSLEKGTLVINFKKDAKGDDGKALQQVTYKVPHIDLFINDLRERQYDLKTYIAELGTEDPLTEETQKEIDALKAHPLLANYDIFPMANNGLLLSILPTVVLIVFMFIIWFLFMRRLNSMGDGGKQMSFGKAKYKDVTAEKRKTTFADVAGADEEKEELTEIVHFLKEPKKFNDLGAHIPKGVLLVGPPGTGKTLLARAVAGEAGVPFFSISGSDFVEMFVGVGASRVRDLFEQAKKNAPCIVFIDEIDAVGRHRGAGLGGGHDEREQTLNQLLVEMDGFGANEGVIIIAATNRPDILDPALTRPGRFDRQVIVGYPDVKGREDILKVHSKNKPLGPDVELSVIAKSTAGFTGADLENLLNEAALLAARRNLKAITMTEIEEATIKVVVGTEKKSRKISDKERRITAVHEAGHAVVTYFCPTQDPVHQISIIPRGMAGGYTMNLPSEDKSYRIKSEILEDIVVLLGGRSAEHIVLGDISTGASNDIERATKNARDMVTKYGMSDKMGPISFGSSEGSEIFLGRDMGHVKDFSDEIAHEIDLEVKEIVTSSLAKAKAILTEHRDKLDQVTEYLLKHEKMSGAEFEKMMKATALDF